jgi:hypothetical protein
MIEKKMIGRKSMSFAAPVLSSTAALRINFVQGLSPSYDAVES